ncbi:efflux RND transporter periplasmic adaptor subunit [Psychroserpens sp.]|uniref:efflux RND transporter periplasmic adaptor subunit n=1 Tax=Psychroserpens sp. TaxID=2020870 RepID=UPI001B25B34E|nr:efflux RND transporter periplasmic adaptor subunit [Psychroserpens sp.]MBO6607773.1 efflux RND transporter periplasmic adaptor subunit [Psychroserpens sp.]MBO6631381.1 efflux RND transporter periplasmic adaptor subunit [Psychroserpens sp.]MBO6654764.1 efflux RND transporter periplasmic adaptor subunit [Psychroserpens sp.]MBO6682812.1 efflux RND transporter periplasmic adaptor subunit [Psychroserpens sp.]MBO6751131.1 efflux RND transporter periplasmic adaptor subunit [Psychroserpens sp.]
MKYTFTLIFTALVLVSCGNNKTQSVEAIIETGDLEQIRAKKAELDAQQTELDMQLKQLTAKIKEIDPQQKIPLITTISAEETVFEHYVELQGNVDTKKNLVIYPEYSGILTYVYVKEGQKVSNGQILAKIDDGGLSQQLSQLEIQADLAKTTFERQKRLWDQNIGSEIQYLQAKSTFEAQQKAVQQLEQQISRTVVRAPFSGTIDDVITEQGSVVAPGQSALFRIVNLDDMYIETDVPESYITNVTEGKMVEIEFPVLGKKLDAKVRQAGNFINPANRTFKVEVGIPNTDKSIKPNLTARLRINDYTNEKAILIPLSIISENAKGEQYVYTVTDKSDSMATAKRAIIKTGKTQGDFIEVVNGLNSTDEIIKEGARSVKDGQQVKIIRNEIAAVTQ